MGRLGQPDEIADMVVFLLSDRSGVVTGSVHRLGPERPRRTGLMRIGLVGLGRIGSFHARTLAALPAVDGLVVTDADPAALGAVSAEVGAEPVPDLAGLLAAGIDGLVVAAATARTPGADPGRCHAGLPVFCEKPVAGDLIEAVELSRELAAAGVEVQIGFPRRFDAGFAAARAAVASGELGDLHTVRSTTLDPAPPPAAYIAVSGGIFRDCVVHDFDAIRWVTGREVVEAYATGGNRGADYIAAAGDVDTCAAVLTLDDGTMALVSDTRHNRPRLRRPAGAARHPGQHRRRARRPAAAALGRAGGDLPGRPAAQLLPRPVRRRVPGRADRVHRGRRRDADVALPDRRRGRDQPRRRSLHALPAGAPARAGRGGPRPNRMTMAARSPPPTHRPPTAGLACACR